MACKKPLVCRRRSLSIQPLLYSVVCPSGRSVRLPSLLSKNCLGYNVRTSTLTMGGVVGSPVTDAQREQIKELSETILKTFSTEYTKAYIIALLEKIRDEVTEEPEDWKLMQRPEDDGPTEPLKEGYMTKQGGNIKTWRRRYFVVLPDYRVEYYETQEAYQQKKKPKGTIVSCGYSVQKDPVKSRLDQLADVAGKMGATVGDLPQPDTLPDHCFELHHSRRRCYFIAPDSAEDKIEWVKMFQLCAWKCKGFESDDEVANTAFVEAVSATREELGHWGYYSTGGTESQILSEVIVDEIDFQVLRDVYGNIKGPWAIRWKIRNQILKVVDSSVNAGVKPAYAGLKATIQKLRERVEGTMKEKIGAVYEAKEMIQDKIQDACLDKVRPVLEEKVSPHLKEVLKVLFSPMADGFNETRAIYEDLLDEMVKKVVYDNGFGQKLEVHFRALDRAPHSMWTMRKAYSKVEAMEVPLWALQQIFEDIEPRPLINEAQEKLATVLDNALYTFENELTEAAGADFTELDSTKAREIIGQCKFSVKSKFSEDASKATVDYYKSIMVSMVMPLLMKVVNPVCSPLLEPIGDLVPEPFKDFIDIEQEFEDTIEKIVQGAIDAVVDPACSGQTNGVH